MSASIGDYIIKGVNGEFYPCKPGDSIVCVCNSCKAEYIRLKTITRKKN